MGRISCKRSFDAQHKANAAAMAELSDSDPYDVADKCLKATEDCLANVREHAKNDLGITRKLPPILEKIAPIALSVARKMTH
jgi:hypothetical protein